MEIGNGDMIKVQENKIIAPSSSSSSPQSFLPRNYIHDVFPSFHGADVRRSFLSHIMNELRRKGINTFIDNDIERGEFIRPVLETAIQGSKIAIVLLSRNYASSSWCLNELVEIMKCKEVMGQIVLAIFYEVDPSDIKKLAGEFGKVFEGTCEGKTTEVIGKWRQALAQVATVAGYHSENWDNEATMIENIAIDISNMLNIATPSRDFDGFVGMRTHIENLGPLLRLDLNEVRTIGILGPRGIGKSTIARVLFNEHSHKFQLSAFMEDIRVKYPSVEYSAQLQLQSKLLSPMLNHKDMVITHLGVLEERLRDKKVFLVLDDVDHIGQLDALAKKAEWFGLGSRIIITTENLRVLKQHRIEHIYKVDFPTSNQAFQMFCMYAFGQEYPEDGFEELAWIVAGHVSKLPLGLKVMGSHFRGMSMQEWNKELPTLCSSLDGEIESALKFSYDALPDKQKYLFIYIACFFNYYQIDEVEEHLKNMNIFPHVRQQLDFLVEKSLISMDYYLSSTTPRIKMHSLLVELGREIVRKNSFEDLRQRTFLVDCGEICEVLMDDATGSSCVIGIDYESYYDKGELYISKNAFEGMNNLQFLRFRSPNKIHLPDGLSYLSPNLRLLEWDHFRLPCLPSNINLKFLVKLDMMWSKLERLWEGIKPLQNLKWINLEFSKKLKELPDLSTATKLQKLKLGYCSSLMELPSSIGKATNLQELDLQYCLSLVKIPFSIGKATNLQKLNLNGCSNLMELPSSIGNATNLQEVLVDGCSSLVELPSFLGNVKMIDYIQIMKFRGFSSLAQIPSFIGNVTHLTYLDFTGCSSLVELPAFIGNLQKLELLKLKGCSKLKVLPVNINLKSLHSLVFGGCSSLKIFPEISTNIEDLDLSGTAIEEVPSSIKSWSCLQKLILKGCNKLLSIPQIPDSLSELDASNCESLERLDCSFRNSEINLNFANCFKLNKEARELIIKTLTLRDIVLPGKEIPTYFTHQATGGSLTVKLKERPFPSFLKFKVCVLLVKNDIEDSDDAEKDVEPRDEENDVEPRDKGNDFEDSDEESEFEDRDEENDFEFRDERQWLSYEVIPNDDIDDMWEPDFRVLTSPLTEHLYIFEFGADVTSNKISFEFNIWDDDYICSFSVKECGVHIVNTRKILPRRRRLKVGA